MTTGRMLTALQFPTQTEYEKNLSTLIKLVDMNSKGAIILAPEVSITGFDYPNFSQAAAFSQTIEQSLKAHSASKTVVTTMIEEEEGSFYNVAKVYHDGELLHAQKKHKLFTLGEETLYFSAGDEEGIKLFECDGLKIGILICFELRFVHLWEKLKGADIILVPAQWGKIRTQHFKTLTQALAIANQAYVIASDASNEDTTASSAIITPFGEIHPNGAALMQTLLFEPKIIDKMRRYIDIGYFNG